jgi:hypothetical protein
VIRPRAKVLAISLICLSIGSTIIWAEVSISLKVLIGTIGIIVSLFILTRKSYAKNHPRNTLSS